MAPKKSATKKTKAGKTAAKPVAKPVAKPAIKTSSAKSKGKSAVAKKQEPEPTKSYKDLITEALLALKERKGSSRPALKKYIKDKYPKIGGSANFDLYFNNAVKKGVETKDFDQPKGPSGTLKMAKKAASPTAAAVPTPTTTAAAPTPASSAKGSVTKKAHDKEKSIKKKMPSPVGNPTYKDMILAGIMQLNEGKGSSRTALKKFVKDQYFTAAKATANFDHLFNSAIKRGVETGAFAQPKGPSGVLKKGKGKSIVQKITA